MSMRLIDLEPRWITPDIFVFRSPAGRGDLLCCPRIKMTHVEQRELFDKAFGEDKSHLIVGWKEECVWQYTGSDFESMTVTPSIDASASGNWHGHITAGDIVGGL